MNVLAEARMSLLRFFQRGGSSSAPVARERLQILLAHERSAAGPCDLVAILREEILAVIAKHLPVERDKVQVKMDRGDAVSTLAVDIEIAIRQVREPSIAVPSAA